MTDGDVTAPDVAALAERLALAGFVASAEEAARLVARAGRDGALLESLVSRRLTGEPLAWVTGSVVFCGVTVGVDRGVYVPRWHSEVLVARAVERLPGAGIAVDLCTGAGAVAVALATRRPSARIVATDVSDAAVACARANGVDAHVGDLFEPVPADLVGRVDLVVGVVPYVPTEKLGFLQRDTLTFESALSYDGGVGGLGVLRRAISGAATFLRPGGALVLELGGDQAEALGAHLDTHGFAEVNVVEDGDGDVRGIEATFSPAVSGPR